MYQPHRRNRPMGVVDQVVLTIVFGAVMLIIGLQYGKAAGRDLERYYRPPVTVHSIEDYLLDRGWASRDVDGDDTADRFWRDLPGREK